MLSQMIIFPFKESSNKSITQRNKKIKRQLKFYIDLRNSNSESLEICRKFQQSLRQIDKRDQQKHVHVIRYANCVH